MELRPDQNFDPFGPDADQYPSLSDVLNGIDYNDPESVFGAIRRSGSNIPIPKQVSPEDYRRQATKRLSAIIQSLDLLHAILEAPRAHNPKPMDEEDQNTEIEDTS